MFYYHKQESPTDIHFNTELIVDRKQEEDSYNKPMPFVCLGLEGVLCKKINDSERLTIPVDIREKLIEVNYQSKGVDQKYFLLERPGAGDFLIELVKYSIPFIYTSQEFEFAEAALLQLSIAQGDPDFCSDIECRRGEVYMELGIWAQEQCMKKNALYMKSLGRLAEYKDSKVNDIWLIDNKPELVDFPSHAIFLPEFTGDLNDRELYKLTERIFIN